MDLMRNMENNSIDLIATDPPFRTISGGKKPKTGFGYHVSVLKENDGKIFQHNSIKASDYLPELYRILKPGKDLYLFTNNLNLVDMITQAQKVGFKFHGLLYWEKNTATPNRWYMKSVEPIIYLYKSPARPINCPGTKQVFNYDNPRKKKHPTEKPVGVFTDMIGNSSMPGEIVFDPFMGGGSCGLAAKAEGRHFIGCEIDEKYYNVAKERLNGT